MVVSLSQFLLASWIGVLSLWDTDAYTSLVSLVKKKPLSIAATERHFRASLPLPPSTIRRRQMFCLQAFSTNDVLGPSEDGFVFNREQQIQRKRQEERRIASLQQEQEQQELQQQQQQEEKEAKARQQTLQEQPPTVTRFKAREAIKGVRSERAQNASKTTTKKKKKMKKMKKKKKKKREMGSLTDPDPKRWGYAWLNGVRRAAVTDLTFDMDGDHAQQLGLAQANMRKQDNNNAAFSLDDWRQEGFEILDQWARLGEGKRCQELAYRLLFLSDNHQNDNDDDPVLFCAVHRPVLHAYCNAVFQYLYNAQTRKVLPQPSRQARQQARRAVQTADQILQQMEETSQKYCLLQQQQQQTTGRVLVDGTDYLSVILGYCRTGQPRLALGVLDRMEQIAQRHGRAQPGLLPTTAIFVTVMKCVLRNARAMMARRSSSSGQEEQQQDPIETAHALCERCVEWSNAHPTVLQPTVALYNIALDAWSRVVPPPSERDTNNNNNNNNAKAWLSLQRGSRLEKKQEVAAKTDSLWMSMQKEGVEPNARTYMSLVYAYTKSDRLDNAYQVVESMMDYLLLPNKRMETVDTRCVSMLIHALCHAVRYSRSNTGSVAMEADRVERNQRYCLWIESLLGRLWDLAEAGYETYTPGVVLYTTALDTWAKSGSVQAYPHAMALVDDFFDKQKDPSLDPSKKPDAPFYNALLRVLANQPNGVAHHEQAGKIVNRMKERGVVPDTTTYNELLQTCVRTKEGLVLADQTLEKMMESGKTTSSDGSSVEEEEDTPRPNAKSYAIVIRGWATVGRKMRRAEEWLDRMEERFTPSADLYESLISSWCLEPLQVQRAKALLFRMEELHRQMLLHPSHSSSSNSRNLNNRLRPKRSTYDTVVETCMEQNEPELAARIEKHRDAMYPSSPTGPITFASAEQVFAVMDSLGPGLPNQQHKDNDDDNAAKPDANTHNFNIVLSALLQSDEAWAGQRAEDVMDFMIDDHFRNRNQRVKPNIVTFNSVMAAWAKSGHDKAGEKARNAMKELDALHEMGLLLDVVADRVTYNTLISAFAKEKPANAVQAQYYFDELEKLYRSQRDERLKPDIISYGTLLNAWARSGQAKRAEEILVQMHERHNSDPSNHVKPNTLCFNEVLYGWARSSEENSARRAEMVLRLMEDIYQNGNANVRPETRSYNLVLLAWANSDANDSPDRVMRLLERMKAEEATKPNAVSYNTAISAFAKQRGADALNSILELLNEAHETIKDELDSRFFATLIHSLSKYNRQAAPSIAETVIDDLKVRREGGLNDVELDTRVYNALISCWGRSGERMAPTRAEEILQDMYEDSTLKNNNTLVQPDVITFTAVIDAWAKSQDPAAGARGTALLDKMEEWNLARPNVQTYTAAIQCHARSNRPGKAGKAVELLRRMKQDFANRESASTDDPDQRTVFAYNAVMNAAEFTTKGNIEEAFEVACLMFNEVRSSEILFPDHVTYGSFMGVIAELMPKSDLRNDMIALVFKRCCADGQLAPVVLKKFQDAASRSQYRKLMGGATVDSLPARWTRNVRGAND